MSIPADFFPRVYDELRKIAAAKMIKEAPGQTLDATALVHEAWLKLAGTSIDWKDRTHFLRTAATAMRHILVDRARAKKANKRGGDGDRIPLQDVSTPIPDKNLIELDDALTKLAATKPEHAALLEMCYFAKLTVDEAAAAMNLSSSTADRMIRYAKSWMRVEMQK